MTATDDDWRLLRAIKAKLPDLRALRDRMSGHWEYEDTVYRFYHGSFKVYYVQRLTLEIVDALQAILPDRPLNKRFLDIVSDGTGKEFTVEVNNRWDAATRPLIEAFFHARYFLEMTVKYGEELEEPPVPFPSGWASVLYLFNMR